MAVAASPLLEPALVPQWTLDPDPWDTIAPVWERLEAAAEALPWLGVVWQRAWWECFGQGKRLRLLSLADPGTAGSWAAHWPLLAESCWGWRRWRGLGADSQRRQPVWAAGAGAVVLPRLAQALAQRRDWDWLQCDQMPAAAAADLAAALRACGLRAHFHPGERQRYVPLDRSWDAIAAHWGSARARNFARRERALARRGLVRCCTITDSADATDQFEACLRLEASGWKGRRATAMLSTPPCARFYRLLVRRLAEHRRLWLTQLFCGDTLLAFCLGVVAHGVLAGVKSGIAEDWRSYGPGQLLVLHSLRQAHHAGLREYDFLGGDDAFKASWTAHYRELANLRAFNSTLRGRAVAGALTWRHRLRRWPLRPAQCQPAAVGLPREGGS